MLKRHTILLFYLIFFIIPAFYKAEETKLVPGKMIFSQGGYLETVPSDVENGDGYLRIGNGKGLFVPGPLLKLNIPKETAPYTIGDGATGGTITTTLNVQGTSSVPTHLFFGSKKTGKFIFLEIN